MRLSAFLSTSSEGELHLIMRLDLLSRRKGRCTLLVTWHLWQYFAISLLGCTPVWDHSRSPFFECWNSRQPREAISIAAAHFSCASGGRLDHTYWFVSWQILGWESSAGSSAEAGRTINYKANNAHGWPGLFPRGICKPTQCCPPRHTPNPPGKPSESDWRKEKSQKINCDDVRRFL